LFRGVYVDVRTPDSAEVRVEAALQVFGQDAFASHTSAARWLRIPIPIPIPIHATEHVTVRSLGQRRRREGIRAHVRSDARSIVVRGLRVSAIDQLFIELAGMLSLVDLVVVGDCVVRHGWITREQLCAGCALAGGAAAGMHARAATGFVRSDVDSPMETRLRMLMVLAGLPEPVVNLTIRDVDGEPIRRFALSWPSIRVIAEYDGRLHIQRESQWNQDLE